MTAAATRAGDAGGGSDWAGTRHGMPAANGATAAPPLPPPPSTLGILGTPAQGGRVQISSAHADHIIPSRLSCSRLLWWRPWRCQGHLLCLTASAGRPGRRLACHAARRRRRGTPPMPSLPGQRRARAPRRLCSSRRFRPRGGAGRGWRSAGGHTSRPAHARACRGTLAVLHTAAVAVMVVRLPPRPAAVGGHQSSRGDVHAAAAAAAGAGGGGSGPAQVKGDRLPGRRAGAARGGRRRCGGWRLTPSPPPARCAASCSCRVPRAPGAAEGHPQRRAVAAANRVAVAQRSTHRRPGAL